MIRRRIKDDTLDEFEAALGRSVEDACTVFGTHMNHNDTLTRYLNVRVCLCRDTLNILNLTFVPLNTLPTHKQISGSGDGDAYRRRQGTTS